MSLIEQLGGYERAKDGLHRLKLEKKDLLTCGDLVVVESEIDAALIECRHQHNIFEPDDYIIHDGELKVFAMWSSAVEGCAYIGYAYAENGEMAHKDEFRHATGEEIKAGKRLEVESEN